MMSFAPASAQRLVDDGIDSPLRIALRRAATAHGYHVVHAGEADVLQPWFQAALARHVDAQEGARAGVDPVPDQRFRILKVGRDHRPDYVAAPERAQHRHTLDATIL